MGRWALAIPYQSTVILYDIEPISMFELTASAHSAATRAPLHRFHRLDSGRLSAKSGSEILHLRGSLLPGWGSAWKLHICIVNPRQPTIYFDRPLDRRGGRHPSEAVTSTCILVDPRPRIDPPELLGRPCRPRRASLAQWAGGVILLVMLGLTVASSLPRDSATRSPPGAESENGQ